MSNNSQFPSRSLTEEYSFASRRVTPCSSEIFAYYKPGKDSKDKSEGEGKSLLQRQSSFKLRESQKGLQFDGHCYHKLKRNTLPAYLQPSQSTPYFQPLSSPVFSSQIQRKIRFTYHSPMNQSLSSLTLPHLHLDQRRKMGERMNVFQFSRKQGKRIRNKLSSYEFSFFYVPKQVDKIENSNQSQENSCKSIPFYDHTKTSIMSACKDSDRCPNEGNSSKMASTISTQSFNDNRRSDFSSNDFKGLTFDSKVSFFGNSKEDLSARIPMAKQLGKTVIIPNNDYNFGGIIEQDSVEQSPLLGKKESNKEGMRLGNEIELRQWNNHVTYLIQDTQGLQDQNLKESIHCGPQIRLQRHKFQLLGEFGREIKESSMSFQE